MTEELNTYAARRIGNDPVSCEIGWTYDPYADDDPSGCFSQALRINLPHTQLICDLPNCVEAIVDLEFEDSGYLALWRPCEPDSFGLTKKEAIENCIAKFKSKQAASKLWCAKAKADLEKL